MSKRPWLVCLGTTAFLVGVACLLPAASAAPLPADASPLLQQAKEFQERGQWIDACRAYDELLRKDRNQPEIREAYQKCLRHVLQARRHRDQAFRQALLNLKPLPAAAVYEEVLVKLRANYIDRSLVEVADLFQRGLEEFLFALEDEVFLREHLAGIRRDAIDAFRTRRDTWRTRQPQTTSEARDQALDLAFAARRSLGLEPAVVIFEFICGACNGLDEYTYYLTPGQLIDAQTALKGDLGGIGSVESALLLEDATRIGLIRISGFCEGTVQELREALAQLQTRGAEVLILDLRGNPGGLFRPAVQVAEVFLPEGVIVLTHSRLRGYNRTFKADNPQAVDLPLVVLVDGETASAAEVVAGALKENQRATLVGQTTFGKGSIQTVLSLDRVPAGMPAGIHITVARFISPANYPYTGRGVTPHEVVDAGPEAQLLAARAAAQRLALMMGR